MTLCTPSPITNPIPICTAELGIGVVANLSATLDFYIKNLTTGRIDKLTTTSDGTGLVVADISGFTGMKNSSYEIWLTLENGGMYEKIDIQIEGTTADTFAISFSDPYDGENYMASASQTLSLA